MKNIKSFLLIGCGLGSLAAVLGLIAILALVSMFAGTIIKQALEKMLPEITGTPVKVGEIGYSLLGGSASITDFAIMNPSDFGTGHAFKTDKISVEVSLPSLLSDKITIKKIAIDGIQINFQQSLTTNNFAIIKGNIDKFIAEKTPKTKDAGQETAAAPSEPKSKEETKTPSKKVVIKTLDITKGKISANTTLDSKAGVTLVFPDIHMKDIGESSKGDGVSMEQAIKEIYAAITNGVAQSLKGSSIKLDPGALKNLDKETLKNIDPETTDKVVDKIKSLF